MANPSANIAAVLKWLPPLVAALGLTGCAGTPSEPYTIDLMPAPDVYVQGHINPFTDRNPISQIPYSGILYATDRAPAAPDSNERFYDNDRGYVLRLGVGKIALGEKDMSWEEARQISLLKNRTEEYPLKITSVEEIGILDRSVGVFTAPFLNPDALHEPAKEFAALINAQLAKSKRKDIYLYVHGYRVIFENPLLVATELWHFLGYQGAFIAYAWPSTPSRFAYLADLETAAYSARHLRLLLEYLAQKTDAEKIHIIGYSAGTRVVTGALVQLALEYKNEPLAAVRRLRLGHAILIGSDYDRALFGGYLEDGLLKVSDTLTVYMSETDKALGISRLIFKRPRLGELWRDRKILPPVADYLRRHQDELIVIDVSGAEDADAGNGHAYFRQSPWVSSDILMTLLYGLPPGERGLVLDPEAPIWQYPEDYVKRLLARIPEYESTP